MLDLVQTTESELGEQHQAVNQECEAHDPNSSNQLDAELMLHDGSIAQRLADGNVTVKGHDNKENKLCNTQGKIEGGLGKAAAY